MMPEVAMPPFAGKCLTDNLLGKLHLEKSLPNFRLTK